MMDVGEVVGEMGALANDGGALLVVVCVFRVGVEYLVVESEMLFVCVEQVL